MCLVFAKAINNHRKVAVNVEEKDLRWNELKFN